MTAQMVRRRAEFDKFSQGKEKGNLDRNQIALQ
jgi:hypothetical protein